MDVAVNDTKPLDLDQGFSKFRTSMAPKYDEPYEKDPHPKIHIQLFLYVQHKETCLINK